MGVKLVFSRASFLVVVPAPEAAASAATASASARGSVLPEAFVAVNRSSFGWFEGDLAVFSAVRTHRLMHWAASTVCVSSALAAIRLAGVVVFLHSLFLTYLFRLFAFSLITSVFAKSWFIAFKKKHFNRSFTVTLSTYLICKGY